MEDGWVVRGTTRTADGLQAIEDSGIEGVIADPERPGTILEEVGDVASVYWLLGSATGAAEDVEAIHGPRLQGLLERLVDTPVRGFVYEAAGTVDPALLRDGAAAVNQAAETWRIPVGVIDASPDARGEWLAAMRQAAAELIS